MIIWTLLVNYFMYARKIHLPPEDILPFPDNHSKFLLFWAFLVVRQQQEGLALRAMVAGLWEGSREWHSSLEEGDLGLARVRID